MLAAAELAGFVDIRPSGIGGSLKGRSTNSGGPISELVNHAVEHTLGSDALFYRPKLAQKLVAEEVVGDEVIPQSLFCVSVLFGCFPLGTPYRGVIRYISLFIYRSIRR